MALTWLVLLPAIGGLAALLAPERRNAQRWVSIVAMAATLVLLAGIAANTPGGRWFAQYEAPWVPSIGVSIVFAMDGFSAVMIAVAAGLGIVSVFASWREIRSRTGVFHLCICWTVAATIGVFLSFDLLLFAFFWEAMLIPAFFMIAIWGHGDRELAALKFLIYNAVAGLGLLAAIFALVALSDAQTFNAFALSGGKLARATQVWLLLGFSLAFLTKLPAPPFHGWLADAHTQAPTAGSILLAGLLLKTGAYGLLRFPTMLFPDGVAVLAPYGLALGVFGALYSGLVACAQTDAKRLVAYTSIAHMCIVLTGIAAGARLALIGATVEMIAHSFSASALFLLIGALYERTHTRDLRALGGLQQVAPRFAASFAFFFAAMLALPGTANFVGEALVVVGLFTLNWLVAILALSTVAVSVIYATRLLKGIVFGEPRPAAGVFDLARRELIGVAMLAAGTLFVGVTPQFFISLVAPAVNAVLARAMR